MRTTIMNTPAQMLAAPAVFDTVRSFNAESKECGDTWHYVAVPVGPAHTAKYWNIQVWDSDELLGTL